MIGVLLGIALVVLLLMACVGAAKLAWWAIKRDRADARYGWGGRPEKRRRLHLWMWKRYPGYRDIVASIRMLRAGVERPEHWEP